MTSAADGIVRVMTWNIHGAHGRNPRFELEPVVELVRRHAPDIVALQEVDSRRSREAGVANPFDALQEALGRHGVRAHAVSSADGHYGQVLIARGPLRQVAVHDLSWRAREKRLAIAAQVDTSAGPLRVVATHLGLNVFERRSQAAALGRLIGAVDVPTVALGDFNDWIWPGAVQRYLGRRLPGRTRLRTFPARLPMFKLDRVFVWPPEALVACRTDLAARAISDHLPVIADLRMSAHEALSGCRARVAGLTEAV